VRGSVKGGKGSFGFGGGRGAVVRVGERVLRVFQGRDELRGGFSSWGVWEKGERLLEERREKSDSAERGICGRKKALTLGRKEKRMREDT